jgi:hypothetical protein
MKKIIFIITCTAFLFTLFQPLNAQRNRSRKLDNDYSMEKLNLSDSQKAKFRSLRFDHKEALIDLESKLKKNKLQIRKLVTQNDFNEEDLYQLIESENDLRTEMAKSKLKLWLDVKDILNDEQKVIWKKHFLRKQLRMDRISDLRERNNIRNRTERYHKFDGLRLLRKSRKFRDDL